MFKVYCMLVAILIITMFNSVQAAVTIPAQAQQHRLTLVRNARLVWGLNAPVATFAAQIHQESGYNPSARSPVGAQGMAQFMPATATWWCQQQGIPAISCNPTEPAWAIRALLGYDKWLYDRVQGASEYDRMWAALRAYNGGLGHWQNEAKKAGSYNRVKVDAACGSARRHIRHCRENLGYPRRIITIIQPAYSGWGRGVQP